MNKIYPIITLLLVFILKTATSEPSLYLNTNQHQAIQDKKSITLMGYPYYFGYGNEIQNEYFLSGQGVNGFSSMIGVQLFKNDTDPIIVASRLYNNLLADNQVAQLAIHRFTKEPQVTFILKTKDTLELNLWRFYRNPDRTEVIGLQYLHAFKKPQHIKEQEKLKKLIQTLSEQFNQLPKISFIW